MAKKSISRVDAEKAEGLETVKNEVPENRLQADQQVADSDSAMKVKPAESSFSTKKTSTKGSSLKQTAIAKALTGSSDAAGMGINAAGRGVSGTSGGILGASNSTSVAGQSRSGSRVGKKLDRTATKINYTPCEQVLVEVDESKPLADAADADQGYNGTYRNEFARSQKIMGAVPGDLMFQRSVDLIMKDKLYFVEGQQVFQTDHKTDVNPTKNYNDETGEYEDIEIKSGNYLHTGLHVGIGENGKVRSLFFDVEDLTPDFVSADDANVASAHRLIKENVAELDRITMDAKAGDEKADLWTPLARAVKEPTALSYYLSSMEADTGAFVHLAYSKATTNFSYQLNRAAKDGLDIITPAIEQCVGWRSIDGDGVTLNSSFSNSLQQCFTTANYRKGDPSLMIAAYDSVGKFNNKADLLLQPRGWRMHLQTADNNMNPLKVPVEYATVFAGQEVFSTIDHDYDPILPICMTDKANLITVHNLNEISCFIKQNYVLTFSATEVAAKYYYKPLTLIPKGFVKAAGYENLYIYSKKSAGDGLKYTSATGVVELDPDSADGQKIINIQIFGTALTEAQLADEYDDYTLLATIAANNTNNIVLHVPIVQTAVTGDSGNGSSVVSAVSLVESKELLKFNGCGHLRYRYADLRNNYTVTIKHPLVQGIVDYINESIGGKFRSLLAQEELFVPMVFSTQYMTLAQLIICAATPWIARVRMNTMRDVIYYEDNIGQYPYQKLNALKNVPFKNYVNFSYSGYDEPLQTKIMNPAVALQWILPEFFWKVGTEKYVAPWYCNENDFNSDGTVRDDASNMSMPSIRSGIRLGLLDTLYGMSEKDIRLSLDRFTKTFFRNTTLISAIKAYKYGRTTDGQPLIVLQSGQVISVMDILSAPRELGLCMDAPLGVLTLDPADSGAYKAFTADGVATSYRIKVWVNNNTIIHPSILASTGVNINRAANYSQKWIQLFANNATSNTDVAGLVFGMNDEGSAEFTPFADLSDGAIMSSAPTVVSLQRSMYTRLQLLPFIISPFDAIATAGPTYSRDIYDLAYIFGLCGFRASDYRESVYNREKEVVNQGITFVSDPWVEDSSIVRNGASSTGQSISKGYELRHNN